MKGYLTVNTLTAFELLPVAGAHVLILTTQGEELYHAISDANGNTPIFELEAPNVAFTLNPSFDKPAYSVYDVKVSAEGFNDVAIFGCQIVATATAILNVEMHPKTASSSVEYIENREEIANFLDDAERHDLTEGYDFSENSVENSNDFEEVSLANAPEQNYSNPLPVAAVINQNQTASAVTAVNQNIFSQNQFSDAEEIHIPPVGLLIPSNQRQYTGVVSPLRPVFIPDYITVHLGRPQYSATNERVRFVDYIANCASSEIYPTWPHNALVANIHAITTFAINRVYTEWYPSRGFNFDITNSTAFDQYFVYGRNIYANIMEIAQNVFNVYARRFAYHNPFFTQFCNGTTVTCRGLSQWGTVPLAEAGRTPLDILHTFYPPDLELVASDNVRGISETFPGTALRLGSSGEAVRKMQNYLNRLRVNFPLIPQISPPFGTFDAQTEAAVRTFQRTFVLADDGVIGRSTWNKISFIYVGVAKLAELDSMGERIGIGAQPPTVVLSAGARGADVVQLQFILNYIAEFYSSVPVVIQDGVFGNDTKNAVIQFQHSFGLTASGVVGPLDWNMLFDVYRGVKQNAPVPEISAPPAEQGLPFPGTVLKTGSTGQSVRTMQAYLNTIRTVYPSLSLLVVDGVFGQSTKSAVVDFQQQFLLMPDGIIGPITWNKIVQVYLDTIGRS